MAAGRLQRWALFLSGFKYSIRYIKGAENGAAGGLSRLPIEMKDGPGSNEEFHYFHFLAEDKLPLDAEQIRKGMRTDRVLSKVYMYVEEGWPKEVTEEVKPYQARATEISIENEILMWGYRVLIPEKFRK